MENFRQYKVEFSYNEKLKMKETKVIKELKNILVDAKTEIDYLYNFYQVACLFDNIEDLKSYLIKEHDLCVDAHNFGVDRLVRLQNIQLVKSTRIDLSKDNEATIKGESNGEL